MLALTSGSDTLVLALKLLGIGPGDEVIVPAYGCAALASTVAWVGARPVFADIRQDEYGIAPEAVEQKITEKTRAVIVAHLFGQPTGGMEQILQITKRRGLVVVEDAAQAFGARMRIGAEWRNVGVIGDIGCFSFSPGKPFAGAGKGGALVVKDERLRERASPIRSYGAREAYVDYPEVGINMILDDLHASILAAKLPYFTHEQKYLNALTQRYERGLAHIPEIAIPVPRSDMEAVRVRYVVRAKRRDTLLTALRRAYPHMKTRVPYPVALPSFPIFGRAEPIDEYPNTKALLQEVIALPFGESVSPSDVDRICCSIRDCYTSTP